MNRIAIALWNPIVSKEYRSRMRTWRSPLAMTVYILLLGGVGWAIFSSTAATARNSFNGAQAANYGQSSFDYVVTPNIDHVIRFCDDPAFRALYADAGRVLLDSRLLARILTLTRGLRPRVCLGSDLTARLFSIIAPHDRIVLIGASTQQARGLLQIAPRQVDADGVAVDVFVGLGGGNVEAAALHRHDQFDLVMEILGQRRVGDGGAVRLDHVGMLGEEKRQRPLVISHLADVLEIIAPDAPDAADGIGFCLSHHGERRLGRYGNDEGSRGHQAISGLEVKNRIVFTRL